MRILAISSAYDGAAAAIVQDGQTIVGGLLQAEHGLAAALPALVARLLAEQGAGTGMVAVVVGPGSFTGLRAGLSVAHGIGLGLGVPVVGVSVAEALADQAAGSGFAASGRALWTAVHARRGRVFIDSAGTCRGHATDRLPAAQGRIAVCGNAANGVAATLAARGAEIMLTPFRSPQPVHVAAAGLARRAGKLPPLPALPLYVDEAAAVPSAGRPPPGAAG